jgi:hypothetical protein
MSLKNASSRLALVAIVTLLPLQEDWNTAVYQAIEADGGC